MYVVLCKAYHHLLMACGIFARAPSALYVLPRYLGRATPCLTASPLGMLRRVVRCCHYLGATPCSRSVSGLFACRNFSLYLVSLFEASTPCSTVSAFIALPSACTVVPVRCSCRFAHDVGLFAKVSGMYVVSFVEANTTPSAGSGKLLACHQDVRGVILGSTTPCSLFRSLRVPSVCTWCRSLKHHHLLTVSASSRAIRKYVASFFEASPPCSRFQRLRVPSGCMCCRS